MLSLEAFRREYHGAWAAADALWWAEHPGTPGPSGVLDPAVEVDRLRRALYGRDVTPSDRAAFARADAGLRAEQDEVARAVRASAGLPVVGRLSSVPVSPGVLRPLSVRASGRPRRAWLVVVATAAAGVVVIAGVAGTRPASAPVLAPAPVLASARSAAPIHLTPTTAPAFAAVLGMPIVLTSAQQAANQPAITLGFRSASASAMDFSGVDAGQSTWAGLVGCSYWSGAAYASASGAPLAQSRPIATHDGGDRFLVVVILKRSTPVDLEVWATPHGSSDPAGDAPAFQAQEVPDASRVVLIPFTTTRPADLQAIRVSTSRPVPFRVEIDACTG